MRDSNNGFSALSLPLRAICLASRNTARCLKRCISIPKVTAASLGGLALARRLVLEERASAISKPLYSIPVITGRTKLIQGGCGF